MAAQAVVLTQVVATLQAAVAERPNGEPLILDLRGPAARAVVEAHLRQVTI
jgi:hypothetical protein